MFPTHNGLRLFHMTSLLYLEKSSVSEPFEDALIFSSRIRCEAKATMEYYNISGVDNVDMEPETEVNHETSITNTEEQNTQIVENLQTLSSDQLTQEENILQPESNCKSVETNKRTMEDQRMISLEEHWKTIDRERLETINRQGNEIKELKTKLTQLHERCVAVENVVKLYLKTEKCPSQTGEKESSLETRLSALEMALGKAVNYMFPRIDEVLSKIEEASGGSFGSFSTTYPPRLSTADSVTTRTNYADDSNRKTPNTMVDSRTVSNHPKSNTTSILLTSPPVSYSEPSITFEIADDSVSIDKSVYSPNIYSQSSILKKNLPKSSQPDTQSILLDPKLLCATQKNVENVNPFAVSSDDHQQTSTTASVSSQSSHPSGSYDTHTSDEDWNGSDSDMYPYSISNEYPPSPRLTSSLTAISTPPPHPSPRPLPADLDSALRDAAKDGNADEICRLLLAGADANAGDNLQTTALHWAAIKGHLQAASALLEGDAAVDCRDVSGWTPLHFAASKGHAAVLAFLLRRGAAVASKDDKHWTPLHVAVHGGHVDCVRILLDNGADAFAADVMGKKMLDLTDSEIVRHVLLRYME